MAPEASRLLTCQSQVTRPRYLSEPPAKDVTERGEAECLAWLGVFSLGRAEGHTCVLRKPAETD